MNRFLKHWRLAAELLGDQGGIVDRLVELLPVRVFGIADYQRDTANALDELGHDRDDPPLFATAIGVAAAGNPDSRSGCVNIVESVQTTMTCEPVAVDRRCRSSSQMPAW